MRFPNINFKENFQWHFKAICHREKIFYIDIIIDSNNENKRVCKLACKHPLTKYFQADHPMSIHFDRTHLENYFVNVLAYVICCVAYDSYELTWIQFVIFPTINQARLHCNFGCYSLTLIHVSYNQLETC